MILLVQWSSLYSFSMSLLGFALYFLHAFNSNCSLTYDWRNKACMLCMLYDNNSDGPLYYTDDLIILNNCSNMLPVLNVLGQPLFISNGTLQSSLTKDFLSLSNRQLPTVKCLQTQYHDPIWTTGSPHASLPPNNELIPRYLDPKQSFDWSTHYEKWST